MIFEILNESGDVINTITSDLAFVESMFLPGQYREVVRQESEALKADRKITQLAFLNRFTDSEAIAIDIASQGISLEAAALRRYQKKVDAANFIDLEIKETRDGILALESMGLLGPGRALEILDSEVLTGEEAQ